MTPKLPIYMIDAFTKNHFTGNPAGVCLLYNSMPEKTMQLIAREVNLSETAFLVPLVNTDYNNCSRFQIRWFTPEVEVPLCGHATLSAAHVLFNEIKIKASTITFETVKRGELVINKQDDRIVMDFPAGDPKGIDVHSEVIDSLNTHPDKIKSMNYCSTTDNLLVEFKTEADIVSLEPDFQKMIAISVPTGISGMIVTAESEKETYDFISRCFAPWVGINEDPVTGSTHTVLGPYWEKRMNKKEFNAYQASKRGGELVIKIKSPGRVLIEGHSLTIIKGEILLPED